MATVSINKRREILDSAKGQMFHVTFQKKDGTMKSAQVKKWIEKAFASGNKNDVGISNAPDANYVYVDMEKYKANPDKPQAAWGSLKLENLKSATIAGITYNFND